MKIDLAGNGQRAGSDAALYRHFFLIPHPRAHMIEARAAPPAAP
jgi:hypothetical protein